MKNVIKGLLVVGVVFFTNQNVTAQTKGAYLELAGNAGIYSLNYEHFFKTEGVKLAGRVGFGLWGDGLIVKTEQKMGKTISIPFGLTGLYNIKNGHNAEFGAGATYLTYKVFDITINSSNIGQQPVEPELVRRNDFFPNFALGYRWQKPEGGLMARIFYNPHITRRFLVDNTDVHSQYSVLTFDSWFGLGVGYGF
jgi:hypothetical protein